MEYNITQSLPPMKKNQSKSFVKKSVLITALSAIVLAIMILENHLYEERFSPEIISGEKVMKRIEDKVVNSDGADLELKQVTDFEWDKVCFEFGDTSRVNTGDNEVIEYLGFTPTNKTIFYIPDSMIAVFFINTVKKDLEISVIHETKKISFEYDLAKRVKRCYLSEESPLVISNKTKDFDDNLVYKIAFQSN